MDERTLQEIYFPAFRKAVQEAGVGAVMDSYNPVSYTHLDVYKRQTKNSGKEPS